MTVRITGFGGKLRIASVLSALLLGPVLSGCILGTEKPELNLEVPTRYREGSSRSPDAAVPALDWWRGFRSGELTALMEDAQIYNLDIAVAIAQIVQADAQAGIAGAPLFPSLTGTGTAERIKNPGANPVSQYNLGLTASYMVDFWGKNRATLYAAEENATAARYNREVVTLTSIVTVANTYFQVLAAQDERLGTDPSVELERPAEVLGGLRRRGRLAVPVVGAITDLAMMHYWAAPGIDLHLVIHPDVIAEVRAIAGQATEIEVVRGLRGWSSVPIIMLSVR